MYKIVNSGIDSLVLGFSIKEYIDSDSFAELEDSKLLAGNKWEFPISTRNEAS